MERFLIDANIFIMAKNNFYQFSFAQNFWDLLLELHRKGIVYSIKAVKDEMTKNQDELSDWVSQLPDSFFEDHFDSLSSYGKLMDYAQKLDVKDIAKEEFAQIDNADAWIVAHAIEHNFSIITQEKSNPHAKKRIMIPNVAEAHQVKCLTLFEFMEQYAGHNFSVKN